MRKTLRKLAGAAIVVLLTGAPLVVGTSCDDYDDSALWTNVNDLAERLQTLETKVATLNTEIETLRRIADESITIVKVESTGDGYTIRFSDGTTATIADGKDGAAGQPGADGASAPIIGVKQDADGVYYWTLTSGGKTEWLLSGGEKLRVTGESITPVISVDKEGFWTISYDGGATSTRIADAAGNPVSAVAKDPEPLFRSVVPGEGTVTFELADGTTLTVPVRSDLYILLKDAPEKAQFRFGETQVFEAEEAGVKTVLITKPDEWRVSYKDRQLTITAPTAEHAACAELEGTVTIAYIGHNGLADAITLDVWAGAVSVGQPAPEASEITDSGFKVGWPAVEEATAYVYSLMSRNANGSLSVVVQPTVIETLSVVCSNLKADTEYLFRVQAKGDDHTTLDSPWTELKVKTAPAAQVEGPWVEFEVAYRERSSYQCYIDVTFKPNDDAAAFYADCISGSYFDIYDEPGFEPNTDEDLIAYLMASKPLAENTKSFQWSYSYDFIIGAVAVDKDGKPGKLHWVKLKTPSRSELRGDDGDDETSQAALRIQTVIANSADLGEDAPAGCFATVYRFELTGGARSFRFEDGFYVGDFAKQEAAYWRKYVGSAANASGEAYDGGYSGWISSNDLELSADGFYYYGVTFWDASMAGETYELIYTAYDAFRDPGTPACITVSLPETVPAPATQNPEVTAAVKAAAKKNRTVRVPFRR